MESSRMANYTSWDFCFTRKKNNNIIIGEKFPNVICSIGQLRQICTDLEETLPGYRFRVEPISGGGIEFVDWPGRESENSYKTIRFSSSRGFPYCGPDTPDETQFYLSQFGKIHFFLKAFDGAPSFTTDELDTFKQIFTNIISLNPQQGWKLNKKYPKLN